MQPEILGAVLSLGGTLAGACVAIVGTGVQQKLKHRRDDAQAAEKDFAALLTASVMFATSVQHVRSSLVTGPSIERVFRSPRTAVLDFNRFLDPRLEKLAQTVAAVTLRSGRKERPLRAAAEKIADAAGELADAITERETSYAEKREAFEAALSAFRKQVDARPRALRA